MKGLSNDKFRVLILSIIAIVLIAVFLFIQMKITPVILL